MTRILLFCGAIAGPIYILVAAIQAFSRDGFDITRHSVSLLSNGDLGWIQIINFVLTGALVIAAAVGLRFSLATGRGARWGPRLVSLYGIGLIASGVFVADAMDGFPPGTPPGDPVEATLSGVIHLAAGGIAFLSLTAACAVYARRFFDESNTGFAVFSLVAGALIFVAFGLIAAFPGEAFSNLLLTVAVVFGWAWLSILAWRHMPPTTFTRTKSEQRELRHGVGT
jgi:hypothetical membrane protein